MMDNSISIKNLTKVYNLYDRPADMVKEAIHPLRKKYHHEFVATDDISLDIKKGETVGIIGKNGAGKSTLLKMITGVLTPTEGSLETKGKISSLLELGAGFNPQLSGLENIYLNGTIMGLSKEEVDSKLDYIIDFADIGEFVHQPVKMYSSGMFARLAFSVSINVDPDILIVDEALSVGDMAFQMKCFKKFQEFQEQGKTILFVTHALDTVIRYCTRGVIIDAGKVVCDDTPKIAVDTFKKVLSGDFYLEKKGVPQDSTNIDTLLRSAFKENQEIEFYGNGKVDIIDYGVLDWDSKPQEIIDFGSEFQIVMKVKFNETVIHPIFAFTIKDTKGLEITGTNTSMKHIMTDTYENGEIVTIKFKQKANFQLGKYALSLGCVNLNEKGVEVYSRAYDVILFDVIGSEQMVGFYDLKSEISIDK